MSTMDYLEFKNYLEHGYEAAMHNKKQSQESVKRQGEVNQTVQSLKDAAIKDIMFYIKDYNSIIERDRQKIVKAKNMLNSPAGTQAKSSYVKTNSGQSSIREEIKFIEYSMNKNIERKEELEKELQEIRSDKTGKKAKGWVDAHKHELHHSSISHASKAGMPTNLKQESSNIKRASERAKFMNQLQQTCDKIRVKYGQLTNLQDANYDTYNDPVRGNGRKTGGGYTGGEEINKLRWKYSKETNPLVKQLHNLLNAGKNSPLFTDAEKEKMRKWMQEGGTLDELATVYSDVFGSVSHDNLEHGWFTDLFKKSYNAKGSTAGMPTNLPRTATSGGSAGSKQLVYSDQLRKLNNNLVEYELKMNQAKASYEEYRKLYNDTKKNIANTEKALTEATKEAARTGFDPSKSSVAAPARRYASSNAILPQTTITGSTEGLKKTRYHVKKK